MQEYKYHTAAHTGDYGLIKSALSTDKKVIKTKDDVSIININILLASS